MTRSAPGRSNHQQGGAWLHPGPPGEPLANGGVRVHRTPSGHAVPFESAMAPVGDARLEFALTQNYPNPFQLRTRIGFRLPERSRVNVAIYDVAGRVVKTLVDGQ